MAKKTDIYNFHTLELGDTWFADLDKRNLQTVENQFQGLYSFVGAGVIEGWEVTSMIPQSSSAIDEEIYNLSTAPADSYLGKQYAALGSPTTSDHWAEVIRVTAGRGIVGMFPAHTARPVYFRFSDSSARYIWAEAGACLATEGVAAISSSLDEEYDTRYTATYLATVSLSSGEVVRIEYGERRMDLRNLAGATRAALRNSLYRHVHLGGEHPSKINLSTQLLLHGKAPLGSTIFPLFDDEENPFSWDPETQYGIPEVRLNNRPLLTQQYLLEPTKGRVSLKNSLPEGAELR